MKSSKRMTIIDMLRSNRLCAKLRSEDLQQRLDPLVGFLSFITGARVTCTYSAVKSMSLRRFVRTSMIMPKAKSSLSAKPRVRSNLGMVMPARRIKTSVSCSALRPK